MADPSAGPILKDATYYGFWARAIIALVLTQLGLGLVQCYLLYRVLRK